MEWTSARREVTMKHTERQNSNESNEKEYSTDNKKNGENRTGPHKNVDNPEILEIPYPRLMKGAFLSLSLSPSLSFSGFEVSMAKPDRSINWNERIVHIKNRMKFSIKTKTCSMWEHFFRTNPIWVWRVWVRWKCDIASASLKKWQWFNINPTNRKECIHKHSYTRTLITMLRFSSVLHLLNWHRHYNFVHEIASLTLYCVSFEIELKNYNKKKLAEWFSSKRCIESFLAHLLALHRQRHEIIMQSQQMYMHMQTCTHMDARWWRQRRRRSIHCCCTANIINLIRRVKCVIVVSMLCSMFIEWSYARGRIRTHGMTTNTRTCGSIRTVEWSRVE